MINKAEVKVWQQLVGDCMPAKEEGIRLLCRLFRVGIRVWVRAAHGVALLPRVRGAGQPHESVTAVAFE